MANNARALAHTRSISNMENPPNPPILKESRIKRRPADIEELVIWTYRDQKADRHVSAKPRTSAMSATAVVCSVLELQAIVDTSGPVTNHDVHPDAERVHELVQSCMFGDLERGLIIYFGRTGAAPDWMPGAVPGCQLRLDQRGKPCKIYDERGHWTGAFQIEVRLHRETLDAARKLYCLWWDSMRLLHDTLIGEGWRDLKSLISQREPWVHWCGV